MATYDLTKLSSADVMTIADDFAEAFKSHSGGGGGGKGTTGLMKRNDPKEREATDKHKKYMRAKDDETKSMKRLRKASDWAAGALQKFFRQFDGMEAIKKEFKDFESSMRMGVAEGNWWNQKMGEFRLGIPMQELHQLNKQSRAAASGMEAWTDDLASQSKFLSGRLGTPAEAAKYMSQQMEMLTEAGVNPSIDGWVKNQGAMFKNMDQLAAMGITYDETGELLKEAANDEFVRQRLRGAASEKERRQILAGVVQRTKEFRLMGMNLQQIKKANAALEQIGGKGPLERFKMAAKAQASLSAMGVEGAERAAEIIRKGDRASPEERKELAVISKNAQEVGAQSRMGSFGGELTTDILMEKSGIKELIGKDGPFGVLADEKVKENLKNMSNKKLIANSDHLHNEIFKNASYYANLITSGFNNSTLIQGGGALLGTILSGALISFGTKFLLMKMLPKLVGMMGIGKAGAGIAKLAGGAMSGIGSIMSKGASWLGKGMKFAGTAAKSLAKKIPVIGAIAGVGFAIKRLAEGDVLGAVGETASGIASIVPGLGTAASVAIDAALMARDIARGTIDKEKSDGKVEENKTDTLLADGKELSKEQLTAQQSSLTVTEKIMKELEKQTAIAMANSTASQDDILRFMNFNSAQSELGETGSS